MGPHPSHPIDLQGLKRHAKAGRIGMELFFAWGSASASLPSESAMLTEIDDLCWTIDWAG
jgi:hypothetical protein